MQKIQKQCASQSRIAIALGDPAGIGVEVTLKALGSKDLPKNMQPLLVGCKQNIELTYSQLKAQGIVSLENLEKIEIIDIPLTEKLIYGEANEKTGEASFHALTHAAELVLKKEARALVTAPIAKYAWEEAGYRYPGQTERLAEIANVKSASMLFTAVSPHNSLRINTLLATTHIPLIDIAHVLTPELVTSKLDILLSFCKKFKRNPKLAVAGLNPHAGEKGKLGFEEINWLTPTLEKWRHKHPEISLEGPVSPDTCWLSTAYSWINNQNFNCPDGILALYHDQGLIPIKVIAFDSAVNTTLGLPFIRTSPDHGTGFDIAGKGVARPESMIAAINTAWELSA
ncbi:4-hydroxythreonine-4-phosphate dehydrogenase PdxA [Prochlorococcus marinus]|uniref:4-hydroxythreonine-4-phosphate dehydrogenase PdxA n=1 Tax=Prochlorococcus marinus TaxID=1219 RepID=UPI0022B5833A|nr:4-hydroxythreonine-4-phosphate dehydrogenase PdxA [Prochlorococcus marinus]